ncbi:MAG: DUF2520 domain-containing protein [Gemmatimonadetes bacterium]|nr:DUF2520 domain-containing protein [Gemmatimonadota bacterium]
MATTVGIIGAGRAGVSLGLALARADYVVRLHGRRAKPVPPPLTLSAGPSPTWLSRVDVIILAVPDDAVLGVASDLAASGRVTETQVVLHLSGALGREALSPLEPSGAALGSLHPLQTLSDPQTAPQRLEGAVATVEGDARAVEVATALARGVGMEPVPIAADHKPLYHAAAVVASNFVVTLAGVAQRLFVSAGLTDDAARKALATLMAGALENVRAAGPRAALTGPVVRGDIETVRRHLAVLHGPDAELYRTLSRAALELARLDPERRRAIEELLMR